MDTRNYIESGIIESYVLGISTPEEKAEVERMALEHPEIKKAILDFELLFEAQTNEYLIQPPGYIKTNIENILAPEFSSQAAIRQLPVTDNYKPSVRNINSAKYIAAASVILLLISTALNFYFYFSFRMSNEQYQALLNERNTLQANNASYQSTLDSVKNQLASLDESFKIMRSSDVKEVKLLGISNKTYFATVYWNKQNKQVYFLENNLEETPAGKQYQLWAIVNGKPVSAGVIDVCSGLCKMKVIPDAQAFAVTLEKQGGSDTPTLTAMAVMGKV